MIIRMKKYYNNLMRIRENNQRFYSDVLPTSEVRILRKNKNCDDNLKVEKLEETQVEKEKSDEFRVNEFNIQMISKNLYDQLFVKPSPALDPAVVKRCQENLLKHGIDYTKCSYMPDVKLQLPKLEGSDLVEHFYNIGERQCAPYRELLKQLASCELPPLPKKWSKKSGWHKYEGNKPVKVPCPADDALIFDVEVLMSAGKRPTLACAVSPKAWYSWVSEPVANGEQHRHYEDLDYEYLIPLETDGMTPCGDLDRCRIVIGHNVSYDRAKIKEQYWLNRTGVRFMDTMSMHTCVSGVTSYQRAVLKAKNKEPHPSDDDWIEISSLNSLSEVHNLYCGKPVDKATRDIFVEGNMEDVHNNFQKLMHYCAADVIATHNVLRELLPLFLERFPHPVTLAGMLELGSAYLPINSNWLQYIESAETVFEDLKLESRQLLSLKADEACRLMENEAYKNDIWMWDQDWSVQTLKLKKQIVKKKKVVTESNVELADDHGIKYVEDNKNIVNERLAGDVSKVPKKEFDILNEEYITFMAQQGEQPKKMISEDYTKKFQYLYDLGKLLPVKRPYLAGYPAWYRKLCTKPGKDPDWSPGANNITTSMQITPKLLRLSWEGYPLHYIQAEGWGFLVPFSRQHQGEEEPRLPLDQLLEMCPLVQCQDATVDADLHMLPKTVDEDLARKAYYARKRVDEKAADNQYHGLGVWCGIQLQGCCHFLRLPHKDGPKYKVGNPLARDFLDMFSQNVLSAQGNEAEKVVSFGRMMSYWRNNRSRIMGQQAVWLPVQHRAQRSGAILPQVVVAGTLTRRASEPTWMTASNAHSERVGSELRAMVQAPEGYRFVGADVDSQELWIAALLGDSGRGAVGGHAFGWAVVAGDKARRTDLHSLTAAAHHLRRDHAKVVNYARIYGAGQNFAERLLKQFNPTMTISEAKSKAAKMFATTKGRRVYTLKRQYMEGFMDEDLDKQVVEMTSYQAMRLAKLSGKTLEKMFERPRWVGGTESDMFNKLEEIAECESPRTAFLSGALSRALEGARGRWTNTRLNWAVQSAAADFLHLMLASMAHLAPRASCACCTWLRARGRWTNTRLNWAVQSAAADFLHLMLASMAHLAPRARFCLSFHDEVRYLVPEEYKYQTALALQITNLITRAFCSQRVGINDLPLSVAFFSSVEVDRVLRKESTLSCTTPSNPHGLEKGYGIPNGESLNIFDVLENCYANKSLQ